MTTRDLSGTFQYKLKRGLSKFTSFPSKLILYAVALLAIAETGGSELPGILSTLGATLGVNVLSSMLERIAQGEDIPQDEIRKIIEDAISSSGIEKLATSYEFQRAVAHLFRRFDLLNFAVRDGEYTLGKLLTEQFTHQDAILEELHSDVKYVLERSEDIESEVRNVAEIQKEISENLRSVEISQNRFPTAMVDHKVNEEVEFLRRSRFFREFDRNNYSIALAKNLIDGELSGGTNEIRSYGLAWCARVLSRIEIERAEEFLKIANELGSGSDISIAAAFISSQNGNKETALSILANIDTPKSRSAALMVVEHHDGPERAIDWLSTTSISMTDLDPDGKLVLLMRQLDLARWDDAYDSLDALTEEDIHEAPVLNHMIAITHLLRSVPVELRSVVLRQLPFEGVEFPLSSDEAAISVRREAHQHFVKAVKVAHQLDCLNAATIDDEYALWLELMDPDKSDIGRKRLETKLRDPKSSLRLVHFALQIGIKLNLEAVELEIERQIALYGEITQDAAIARFALAFTQRSPEDVANYVARHHVELSKFFDKKSLQFLQIDMLTQAGKHEKANELLEIFLEDGLTKLEEDRLRRIIAQAEGGNSVDARIEQFMMTDSLGDLVSLVNELEISSDWDGVCKYGLTLFERTRSLQDAERVAKSLSNTSRYQSVVEFLAEKDEFRAQSKNLQMLYCWSLYYEGKLLESRSEMEKMAEDRDDANYRALKINLGIALGDWASLSAFVAAESRKSDQRNSQELIRAAQMAVILESPHSDELIYSAAEKGCDDAEILTAAYILASSADLEDDEHVFEWMHKAAAISGDDGPIHKMTLKDILDRKPEWDRHEAEIWENLSRGEFPIFLAAQSLNRSLVDLMLFPALANLMENDPRRRAAIPAYSGKRQPITLQTIKKLGIDATALLTLSFLNLLDQTIDSFDRIFVPHSTLEWLFLEKQRATFHQPSRIRNAHQIRHLLATNVLEEFIPSSNLNIDLSSQVGEELAHFISEAEQVGADDCVQHVVVRSSPVHRIGSLMDEEADLSSYTEVLSSCQPIVNKLRERGQITSEEAKNALSYLQLHEKPWQQQPEISDGATLYLDGLAISYFQHLGILEKLKSAGFRLIISSRTISEINGLISYENISDKVTEVIENIRSTIHNGIISGKIKVDRQHIHDGLHDQSIFEHPSAGVISLASYCDVIISDDRFLNEHVFADDGLNQATIISSLDLIDLLHLSDSLSIENRLEYRTIIRRAGYFFVPLGIDELAHHLNESDVRDGKIIETAELKAIRENILRIRMSNWLQIPKESTWLDSIFNSLINVLHGLWVTGKDISHVRARSDWIRELIDIRGWAHLFTSEAGLNLVNDGYGAQILRIITTSADMPQDVKNEFRRWVEDRILAPLKEHNPEIYLWIVDSYRRQIAIVADMDFSKEITDEE